MQFCTGRVMRVGEIHLLKEGGRRKYKECNLMREEYKPHSLGERVFLVDFTNPQWEDNVEAVVVVSGKKTENEFEGRPVWVYEIVIDTKDKGLMRIKAFDMYLMTEKKYIKRLRDKAIMLLDEANKLKEVKDKVILGTYLKWPKVDLNKVGDIPVIEMENAG
jgi:hypothetical protein